MSGARDPVTVFLPTWNAGPRLAEVLTAVRSQRTERAVSLRAIDSGSTDATRDVLDRHGVAFSTIDQKEFDHGLIRNRGVRESETPLVAFLSQDARPVDENWLEALLGPFEDPRVAGTWSRQVPRPQCHPFQRLNLEWYMTSATGAGGSEPLTLEEWDALEPARRLGHLCFDDVASAVRCSVLEEVPYRATSFGEDMVWARDVLLAGHRIVFAEDSVVEHSHGATRAEFYDRVVLTHREQRRLTDYVHLPTRWDAVKHVVRQARSFAGAAWTGSDRGLLTRLGNVAQALPFATLQTVAMRRGARQGRYEPPDGAAHSS